jgi:molybdopterin-guanine dinucleotide biosynthesis protein A
MMQVEQSTAFSVLVLCGGQSRRMGRDKALLELEGQTLLERCKNLGAALGAQQVLVSRNEPGFIQDLVNDAGPMAGIAAALPYCLTDWLLVLPVDMPLLTPAALKPLFLSSCPPGSFIEGFPLPVLLRKTARLQQTLAATLSDPTAKRSLHQAWTRLGLRPLPLLAPFAFQNCNDPTSFASIQALLLAEDARLRGVTHICS